MVFKVSKKLLSKGLYALGKAAAKARPQQSMLTQWEKLSHSQAALEADRIATSDSLVFANRDATRAWAFSGGLGYREDGLVLEFGVRLGGSLRQIALEGCEVIGFDSFEGIRDPWTKPGKGPGSMNQDGVIPPDLLKHPRITVVKGWVEDTLVPFLEDHSGPVRLAHLDLDVYPPTKYVLEQIASRVVKDSVLVFDDYFGHLGWQNHSYRAFHEVFDEEDFIVAAISPTVVVFRRK